MASTLITNTAPRSSRSDPASRSSTLAASAALIRVTVMPGWTALIRAPSPKVANEVLPSHKTADVESPPGGRRRGGRRGGALRAWRPGDAWVRRRLALRDARGQRHRRVSDGDAGRRAGPARRGGPGAVAAAAGRGRAGRLHDVFR